MSEGVIIAMALAWVALLQVDVWAFRRILDFYMPPDGYSTPHETVRRISFWLGSKARRVSLIPLGSLIVWAALRWSGEKV